MFSVQGDLLTSAEVTMRSTAMGLMLSFRGTSSAKNKPKYDMIAQIQVIPCTVLFPVPYKIIIKKNPKTNQNKKSSPRTSA